MGARRSQRLGITAALISPLITGRGWIGRAFVSSSASGSPRDQFASADCCGRLRACRVTRCDSLAARGDSRLHAKGARPHPVVGQLRRTHVRRAISYCWSGDGVNECDWRRTRFSIKEILSVREPTTDRRGRDGERCVESGGRPSTVCVSTRGARVRTRAAEAPTSRGSVESFFLLH